MAEDLSWRPRTGDIPSKPGVYRWLDANGRVIYVGKAKNLRARLSSYFAPLHTLHERTRRMVTTARELRWTIVGSEFEALQLEYTWIKEFDPPFNVQFKDDKSYPYLALTMSEEIPRVTITRGRHKKGDRYFGPYVKVYDLRSTIDSLLKVFPMRSCKASTLKRAQRTGKPCLLGDIGKCSAPCVGRVSIEEHRETARHVIRFMAGQDQTYIRDLRQRMQRASDDLEFEQAARLRDQLQALDSVLASTAVVLSDHENADVLGISDDDLHAAVHVFMVRGGRIRGVRTWLIDKELEMPDSEFLAQALQHVYLDDADRPLTVPVQILLPAMPADAEAVTELLERRRGGPVHLRVPQRGEKLSLQQTVTTNAAEALRQYKMKRASDYVARSSALTEIARALGMSEAPLRMECYDISHLGGTDVVASMVVFEDGLPKKRDYRKFSIVGTNDDTASIHQVISRRLAHLREQQSPAGSPSDAPRDPRQNSFQYFPSLIIVDGGAPQVAAAKRALEEHGFADRIALAGIAKRLEELWVPDDDYPVILPRNSEAMFMVQRIRDEAHRFAITYQRNSRTKAYETDLAAVPGIGDRRARDLLRHFGSPARVAEAGVDELCAVPGIGATTAQRLAEWQHRNRAKVDDHEGERERDSAE
ncbi:excinuclease ABC subunit UvrC [Pseudoclavibacter sp. CFCC 11306]|uniref:excinuclease ABC subunit UvrC n=1 Tax=Pseudoclavibacter sp. CFCC 11306 TaxID=1564493 RepID=UPI0013013BE8|nr:excinuclease ABC subunit UvrC [Pseudoclavibacter sp. CFCC 11306]KAB1658280.1 excinuclease ABC subunit UvrC [Pseudoclavibacter sp. CFCC 11306]